MSARPQVPVRAAASAPAAVSPPPGHPRFALIDSLRAIAAIAVLLSHTAYNSGADASPVYGRYLPDLRVGLALFFLISGFLLYRPFVASRLDGAPGTRIRDFARRRLLRIVPAYWAALTLLAIWPGLVGVFTHRWWVYYGFLQIYSFTTTLQGIPAAWSLCVEMSFYAVLPLYALAVSRALRSRSRHLQVRAELLLLLGLAVGCLLLRYYLEARHPFSFVLSTLPAEFDWFAAGMALAVMSAALERCQPQPLTAQVVHRYPGLCWVVAAIAYLIVSHAGSPGPAWAGVWSHVLYAIAAGGLLLPAVIGGQSRIGWVRRALSQPLIAWLGLISYGIYLWHQPLLDWMCPPRAGGCGRSFGGMHLSFVSVTLATLGLSVVCAALSYYVLERPLLRFKPGWRSRPLDGPPAPASPELDRVPAPPTS